MKQKSGQAINTAYCVQKSKSKIILFTAFKAFNFHQSSLSKPRLKILTRKFFNNDRATLHFHFDLVMYFFFFGLTALEIPNLFKHLASYSIQRMRLSLSFSEQVPFANLQNCIQSYVLYAKKYVEAQLTIILKSQPRFTSVQSRQLRFCFTMFPS